MNSRLIGLAMALLGTMSEASAERSKADYFNAYTQGDEISRTDVQQTELALKTFFSIANEFIPTQSTCRGDFGKKGRARIADLLVSRLSGQFGGTNNLFGLCEGTSVHRRCTLFINHADGEDQAAAQVSIVIKNGKVDIKTLSCALD